MRKILKIIGCGIISVFIVLTVTNPSLKNFKEHIGDNDWKPYVLTFQRESNWLIFSTYRVSYMQYDQYADSDTDKEYELNKITGTYTGFFLNFYKDN